MKYIKVIFGICTLLISATSTFAQYNKVSVEKIPPMMEVLQVDNRESSTMVYLKYTRQDGIDWSNINEKTFARVNGSYKQYHLINSINMPISSEAEEIDMLFDYPNQVHCFALEFEKIPNGATFDVIKASRIPMHIIFSVLSLTPRKLQNL